MEPKPTAAKPVARAAMHLPILVFGIVEVRRLRRELESLEEFMRQAELRESGKQATLPRLSRLLDALASENHMNLLQPADRKRTADFLQHIEKEAPNIHISFATDPSSAFTAKVVTWLRSDIDPNILLDIGLQPTIAAGCIVRTTNKIFDMSLRERFADATGLLLESLEKGGAVAPPAEQMTAAPAVQPDPSALTKPTTTVVTPPAPSRQPQPTGAAA